MYLQYPLETLARKRGTFNQLEFANAALRVLPNTRQAVLAPHEPKRVLHEAYGDSVEVRDPRVRYLPGSPLREPIMQVRITSRREDASAVPSELRKRGPPTPEGDPHAA